MKKVFAVVTCCSVLAGCGSVTQPVAQVSLVDSESFSTLEQSSLIKNQLTSGNVTIEGVTYTVGETFYSASGSDCRFLTATNKQKLFCDSGQGGWREIDDVLVQPNGNK